MSVQFGRWNIDGRPVDPDYLAKAERMLAPYGPDGGTTYIKDSVGMVYGAFHTTKESRDASQPYVVPSGIVFTWDGRLDNRLELVGDLRGHPLAASSTDVAVVARAFETWGTGCFARLIGDWALSIWEPNELSLILARDPIGTRHLYYSLQKNRITWSTILDPLVLLAQERLRLEAEYLAGWLSYFPMTHLTPYVGIHSVPPSSCVLLRAGKHTIFKYWDFNPAQKTRYRTDAEYEEHLRAVFSKSVRRRLRSDRPVLAELSGGIDSSSIVCMADTILAHGADETARLDTVSYYNDSEPNWNERPYFSKVEEKRGQIGCHIDVGLQESFLCEFDSNRFAATPGAGSGPNERAKQLATYMQSQGNRVVLSGIGGDEVMGGVPTPTPELEDLLARAHFRALAKQLKLWALNKRKPWFYLLFDSARGFLPSAFVRVPKHERPAPWLNPRFVTRNLLTLQGQLGRLKFFGPLPTFQENLKTLQGLQRQLACSVLSSEALHEKRFPYLDRELLEFIYSVPREQLVRPGQRRSLMRRALVGIVPEELLNRKRKAYVVRSPLMAISTQWDSLAELTKHLLTASMGIVDPAKFRAALQMARNGQDVALAPLMRTLGLELWLRSLRAWPVATGLAPESSVP